MPTTTRPDYDDYEILIPNAAGITVRHQRRRRYLDVILGKRCRICCCLLLLTVVIFSVLITIYILDKNQSSDNFDKKYKYRHAAVASDVSECSQVGTELLKSGGSAVDAAIGTLLCMGATDAQSMGIGGGFFMTIYDRKTQSAITVDARETAPAAASKTMFNGNSTLSETGPLSIAVPGEIRGYWMAHQQHGRLPWSKLFAPAIKMTELGFKVPRSLAKAFQDSKEVLLTEPSLRKAYVNPDTGHLYKEGEALRLPKLSATLRKISEEGAAAFYNGSLTGDILSDLQDIGSIIQKEDLNNYKALLKSSITVTLQDGLRVFSPPPPSSGVLLSFMLNVLEGYNLTSSDFDGLDSTIRTMHRIVETFKFAYAKRTDLGDEDFVNVTDLVANLTSQEYADHIRSLITDNTTHNISYYGPAFEDRIKTGTAHLAIVDADGNAVSVTSTVNARFGSKRRGKRTGIVFNNEMDDFSSPNITNIYGIPPSPANFIKPGKRPLSSMCPAILVGKDGTVRLVVGAAGGSRITTATAYVGSSEHKASTNIDLRGIETHEPQNRNKVTARELWSGDNIGEAVRAKRIHHQLLPDYIDYEMGFDKGVLKGLEQLGHEVKESKPGESIVQAISHHHGMLYAASDPRKGGTPDGY